MCYSLAMDTFENTPAALAMMGISVEQVQAAEQELKALGHVADDSSKEPKLICLCGHGVTRHSEYNGLVNCSPSRISCPCHAIRPVLQVQDTRLFRMKTFGPGSKHALTRGMVACAIAEKSFNWVIDLKCDTPGCEKMGASAEVVPTPVSSVGQVFQDTSGGRKFKNVLMCKECRELNK